VRELLGLLLLLAGFAGLEVVLFLIHPLAGWCGIAVAVGAVGAWLTVSEV
jgi:hypothetical protein